MSVRSRVLRTAFIALWIALALYPLQRAHAGEKMFFNIPAGPANQTLHQYTQSTQLQVLWPTEDAVGIVTNELKGEFNVVEALAQMTRDTRLRPNWIDAESVTVSVVPVRAARGRSSSYALTTEDLSRDRRSLKEDLVTITVLARGNQPTIQQTGSNLFQFNRTNIDAFAFATPQDVLRTLPQVFGGGPTEDTRQGFEARTNSGIGAGVNLRGLGAGSTLTLINGRRLAGSGSEAIFADISNIPLAAVERIEILPDSSSTTYGADAVGGVVNFVLLDSFNGAQTDASFSAATEGQFDQHRVSQIAGIKSRLFDGLVLFDFLGRDALAAADRRQARSDLTMFGGNNFDTIQSNPGTIILGPLTWAVPRGQDGTQLDFSMLRPNEQNKTDLLEGADLLPSQQRWSLYATGKKDVAEKTQVFADALFSERDVRVSGSGLATTFAVPTTNPFRPKNAPPTPLLMAYDMRHDLGPLSTEATVRTLNVVAGVDTHLRDDWQLTATGNFAFELGRSNLENTFDPVALTQALADSNRETAFNPFGDGSHTNPATLERIRASSLLTASSELWSGNVTATHEMARLSGGKLVLGTDYRQQNFGSLTSQSNGIPGVETHLQRTMKAAFASVSLPLLRHDAEFSNRELLEVSLAGRYEDYSDFGSILTPRFGLTWAPAAGLVVRGTWSKAFRPPNLLDLDESRNIVTLVSVSDPARPGVPQLLLAQVGKNAQLREEHARTWTLGFDLDVPSVPGLSTAFTYFHTTFTDRMFQPPSPAAILADPALAADLVTFDSTPEQRRAVCESARYATVLPFTCMDAPIVGIADVRVRNSLLMRTNGVDVLGQYVRYGNGNTITFRVDGTYILSFAEAQTPKSSIRERVSTQYYPIDLRLRGSFDWQRGPFRAGAFVNYFDDYRDIASTPQRRVSSWTTFDLNLSYSLSRNGGGPFSGTTFSLSAENLLDEMPPFLNNSFGIGYDQENGELTGRILSLSVRKNW
jgi:iron complex outermembrane recepter protein